MALRVYPIIRRHLRRDYVGSGLRDTVEVKYLERQRHQPFPGVLDGAHYPPVLGQSLDVPPRVAGGLRRLD